MAKVAAAMEGNTTAEAFAAQLANGDVDPFEALWGAAQADATLTVQDATPLGIPLIPPAAISAPTASVASLFGDDYLYVRDALNWLRKAAPREHNPVQFDDAKRTLSFQPSRDLTPLLKRELASEMWPTDNQFALSADKAVVDAAIQHARDANAWPQVHFLWPLHPIVQWLDYKLMALFGRQRAPVIRVQQGLEAGEAIVLVLAQVPNRRGQTMLTEWMGVHLDPSGKPLGVLSFDAVSQQTGLGSTPMANDGWPADITRVQAALPAVVQVVERHLKPIKQGFDADCRVRLERELAKLKTLQYKHYAQLELDFAKGLEQVNAARRKLRESDTDDLFKTYQQWIKHTLELDDRAQLTVVAVLAA